MNKYQTAGDHSFDLLTDRLMRSVTDQLLIMYGVLLQHFFFVAAVVYSQ